MTDQRPNAVVTGAGSGIGRALSHRLATRGIRVVLTDIDRDAVESAAESVRSRGGMAEARVVDVCDAEAVEQLMRGVWRDTGRLDYVFNNAGIAIIGEVQDMSLSDWQRVLDVDLRGVVHGVVAAYPIMMEQGSGHIVNIGSVAGLVPTPSLTAYSAAKHGVVGLSLSLRSEAKQYGVQVNVVCPGIINTPMKTASELRNMDRAKVNKRIAGIGLPVEVCARDIMRGVDRDRPIILIGRHGTLLYHFFRLQPWLYGRMLESGILRILQRLRSR